MAAPQAAIGRRSAFWRWRHARPFWGGLLVTVGGAEIFLTVMAPLPVIVHVGMSGLAGYLVPVLIVLCGVLLVFNPQQRLFYSLVAALLALGSWITSNLGGFIAGLLLCLVGSALAFAWSPDKLKRPRPAPPENADNVPDVADTQEIATAAPGVQPETSQSLPRHRRPSPGSALGE
jgi:hypothetical protein